MHVRAGRPAFAWPYAGVHRSTSLTSSSLLLQQCPACVVRLTCIVFVKVTYLGIRSAHERVWLVERKPIWLPRAYLMRGDLEPARGNLHVCKFLRELTNIQIRTVTAERKLCSECICPTNVLQLNEGRMEGRKEASKQAKEGRKEGRREPEGERERRKEGELGRKRERKNSYRERERKRSTQYALKPTTVSSLELIQESVSYCLLRPLLTTVFVMGGRWPYSWCLAGCCRQDLFNIARNILV